MWSLNCSYKIINFRYKRRRGAGFTLPELLIAITFAVLLFSSTLYFIRPNELRKKARDSRRISDLSALERAITEYHIDTGDFPDVEGIMRESNISFGGEYQDTDGTGWIPVNLSEYLVKLPVDPLNEGDYLFRYIRSADKFEIDCKLEKEIELMLNSEDGGDDDGRYELGTDLTLL